MLLNDIELKTGISHSKFFYYGFDNDIYRKLNEFITQECRQIPSGSGASLFMIREKNHGSPPDFYQANNPVGECIIRLTNTIDYCSPSSAFITSYFWVQYVTEDNYPSYLLLILYDTSLAPFGHSAAYWELNMNLFIIDSSLETSTSLELCTDIGFYHKHDPAKNFADVNRYHEPSEYRKAIEQAFISAAKDHTERIKDNGKMKRIFNFTKLYNREFRLPE